MSSSTGGVGRGQRIYITGHKEGSVSRIYPACTNPCRNTQHFNTELFKALRCPYKRPDNYKVLVYIELGTLP